MHSYLSPECHLPIFTIRALQRNLTFYFPGKAKFKPKEQEKKEKKSTGTGEGSWGKMLAKQAYETELNPKVCT